MDMTTYILARKSVSGEIAELQQANVELQKENDRQERRIDILEGSSHGQDAYLGAL